MEYGSQYVALLQVVDEDLHLCAGINEENEGEEDNGVAGEDWGEDWGRTGGRRRIWLWRGGD